MSKNNNNSSRNNDSSDKKGDMVDWWAGTVILAFFPTIASIVISLYKCTYFDINRMIGDGELILSAFLITTPSIINSYKENSHQRGREHRVVFFLLLFIAFSQLVAYTSIKTRNSNNPIVVYITSALCVCSSIIVSWRGELLLQGGKENGRTN